MSGETFKVGDTVEYGVNRIDCPVWTGLGVWHGPLVSWERGVVKSVSDYAMYVSRPEVGGWYFYFSDTNKEEGWPRLVEEKKEDVALKNDNDKAPMWLLPGDALEEIAYVLGYGAEKYAAFNWAKGFKWSRVTSACLRHVFKWLGGEDKDPETGRSHLAHAACCLLFLLAFERRNIGTDDRKGGA